MTNNLGETSLRRRNRQGDAMRSYDGLPPELRHWVASASLPWSPASCLRIWRRARAQGEIPEAILARLDRAQRRTIARDKFAKNLMKEG